MSSEKKAYTFILKTKAEENKDNTTELNPCLVEFPYNFPSLSYLNSTTETKWTIGQNKSKKLLADKSIICETPKIIYESRSKGGMNKCEYVLGVLNKKRNNEISLYDIDALFPMNQKVRKIEEHLNSNDIYKKDSKADKTTGSNKLELMTNFGTAKAQKMANNMKTNLVGENNISSVKAAKKILKDNAMSMDIKTVEEEKKKNEISIMNEILPKFDLETNDVTKIFDIEYIIDNDTLLEIDHKPLLAVLKTKGCEGIDAPDFDLCEFVIDYLKNISPRIISGHNYSNKIKYSIYLNELIKFYLLPKTLKDNSERLSTKYNIPKNHVDIMLEKYTKRLGDKGSGVHYLKDKIQILRNIYHIIVLSLILNGYQFNYEGLCKVMKIEMKQMIIYFKEIGCTFKSDIKKSKTGLKNTIVKLEAPLKLNYKVKNFAKK